MVSVLFKTVMMKKNNSTVFPRHFAPLALAFALALAGCSSSPKTLHQEIAAPTSVESGTQISNIQLSIQVQNYQQADILLFNMDDIELSAEEHLELQLLNIESAIGQYQAERAKEGIDSIDYEALNQSNDANQARFSLLKARYYELTGTFLSAARERDYVSAILEGKQKEQNHEMIWQDLVSLPIDQLNEAATKFSNNLQFSQWLQLAAIAKHPEYTLDEHVEAIHQWQQANLGHPANNPLPANLKALEDIAENQPQHLALLLPLSGKLGRTGQAIRDGFLAAYFKNQSKGAEVPKLTFIDTANLSIDQAMMEAENVGAEAIIGPLKKQHISDLMLQPELSIPVLALNYADRPKPVIAEPATEPMVEPTSADSASTLETEKVEMTRVSADQEELPLIPDHTENLFQYGLAAEDEARMIAVKAFQDGHRRALAFLPENAWGQRIYTAFEDAWLELGGEIAEQRFYPKVKDYNPEIKAVLNVDDSQQRFRKMRRLIRGKVEYEPRRREDADFIFLVALPKQARQIKPTLAFNFARDIPVYATSHIFSGKENRQKDRDLNGIVYTETPWLLQKSQLRQEVESNIPRSKGGYSRLYAMGIDAFRLYPRLTLLSAFPDSQVPGVTGDLIMNSQGQVQRRMMFGKFRGGRPQLIPVKQL